MVKTRPRGRQREGVTRVAEKPDRKVDGDAIYAILREEIVTGAHAPDTPFRELHLAERFGVSRTPVREALSKLQQEQLLVRVDRGLRIPKADPERVIQVYDLRIQLESTAAGEAARSHQLSDLLQLQALISRDRGWTEPSDKEKETSNLEFHAAIWEATHNPVLIDLLDRLSTHLIHTPKPTLSVGNRWEESLDEHEAITEAIEARDSDAAAELARAHMTRARNIRLDLLRENLLDRL